MSKRTAIIIIVAVILVGTAILYFLLGGKTPSGIPIFTGSPFGTPPEGEVTPPQGEGQPTPIGTDSQGRELPRFVRLSDTPVAGAVGILKNGSSYVRYVDRATGHVYDINPSTLEKTKILNTTRAKTYSAVFKPDGSGYIARNLAEDGETIANTAITIVPPKATSTEFSSQTSLLRGNIREIAVSPNGNLVYNTTEPDEIVTSTFVGDKTSTVLSSAFTNWRFNSITSGVVLSTKATSAADGFVYILNIANSTLTKLLGPLNALTALPNTDASRIAYTYNTTEGALFLSLSRSGITLSIKPVTLAEKCTWSRKDLSILICGVPDGGLGASSPDEWYAGKISYNDRIWRFNTDTNTSEILLDPVKNYDTAVDATNLALTPDEDYLIFTNKKDLTLWALKLKP